ncbi:MAG: hypothetical protein ACK5XN_24740 [Bacteroidota bacterium]
MIQNLVVESGVDARARKTSGVFIAVRFVANGKEHWARFGYRGSNLIQWEGNKKIEKGSSRLLYTGSLSLSPSKTLGVSGNVCAWATEACIRSCVEHNGNGKIPNVQLARIARKAAFSGAQKIFCDLLEQELTDADRIAYNAGKPIGVRLNCFSDIPWEKHIGLGKYHDLRFYDYSKGWSRLRTGFHLGQSDADLGLGKLCFSNYRVCFSSIGVGEDWDRVERYLRKGGTVAVVFFDRNNPGVTKCAYNQELPKEYRGFRVIDGDLTDDRYHDEQGVIVGLRLKSPSWKEWDYATQSGFPIDWRAIQIAG